MGSEGPFLALDLRYVRRLVDLSIDEAIWVDGFPDDSMNRLFTAIKVLNRLIEQAEERSRHG